MFSKSSKLVLLLTVSLLSSLALAEPLNAQTLTARDSLKQAIQNRAKRDVELQKAAASLSDLKELFGERAAGASLSMSEVLDIYEAAYTDAARTKPWWSRLAPNTGWMLAALLFVLFILRDILKENFTKFFNWIVTLAYNRLAGHRLFWRIALNRYREALVERYQKFSIPFRHGKPLNMKEVYVPLKAAETGDTELIDAYQAITRHRRLMVVGTPGSGKSMLLRHIALTYALGEHTDRSIPSIPVLIELSRLTDSTISLQGHLAKTLAQNDFPHAGNFVEAGLKHGLLLLLFDGLDEVNSIAREQVVNQIKDLLTAHSSCRSVVTCRTAVYKDEFGDCTDQKLEIVEFSDQQIQRFLSSWEPDLPPGKSVEHLLRNLSERPRIMALARNPLLLTIIAYLYADTEFVLPHSRTEFYSKSVDVLLEQWKEKRNKYKLAQKQLVLQHLALTNQDSVPQRKQDRRSIDLTTALAEIKTVLPTLTLSDDDAQPILDEIVQRSGLLISIDGGLKYQFAHLTLQEFFAARELEAHSEDLIACFKIDPDTWRETAKLWCGLPHDSTQLIGKIYAEDAITAFECLGDAQKIDLKLANKIVTAFEARLGETGDTGDAVIRAFATVANAPGARGRQVRNFLAATATDNTTTSERRLAAANALALTNLPQAAEILAQHAPDHPKMQPLLAQMGDLAAPILSKRAKEGQIWALDVLQTIGTPRAAQALTPLLWDNDKALQHRTAWRMVTLLPKPNIESSLSGYSLTSQQQRASDFDWIWEPFGANATLRIITGRIAHLLQTAPADTIPTTTSSSPDVRMVIPLCTVVAQEGKIKTLDKDERSRIKDEIKQEKRVAVSPGNFSDDVGWRYLFSSLASSLQVASVRCLFLESPKPNRNDWRNVMHPVQYEFKTSWQSKGIRLMLAILSLLSLWEVGRIIIISPQFLTQENGLAVVVVTNLLIIMLWGFGMKQLSLEGAVGLSSIVALFAGALVANVVSATGAETFGLAICGALAGALAGALGSAAASVHSGRLNKVDDFGGMKAIATDVFVGVGALAGTLVGALVVALVGARGGGALVIPLVGALGGCALVVALRVALVGASEHGAFDSTLVLALSGALFGALFGVLSGVPGGILGGALGGSLVGAYAGTLVSALAGALVGALVGASVSASVIAIGSLSLYLPTKLFNLAGWMGVVAFCLVLVLGYGVLLWHGARRQRLAQNPLKELVELSMAEKTAEFPVELGSIGTITSMAKRQGLRKTN